MRTFAWAYSAARATEPASGQTSPSCHLHQERPPFVQGTQSKCPSIKALSMACASGRAVLYSPQSRAALDVCPPTAEPSGPGPRLVHNPSEPSGSQRSPTVSSGTSFAQATDAILGKQALGRTLIRSPWPGAATRDENRAARPSSALLGATEPVATRAIFLSVGVSRRGRRAGVKTSPYRGEVGLFSGQ